MHVTRRPASLVPGWQGAWALNVRPILAAIRDNGPLTFEEVANVLIYTALRADLRSGHNKGDAYGREMLARAILEDAADVVTVLPDGRYHVDPTLTSFTSPYTGERMKLLTREELAESERVNALQRPVRHWVAKGYYNPYGGKWVDGLPGRRHDPTEVSEMAQTITLLGWQPGARIVKDQHGVTIDGFLRHLALRSLGIDPDLDPEGAEPYVEIRSFDSDAARLLYALQQNWPLLKHDTRRSIGRAVFGGDTPLTLDHVARSIRPVAEQMRMPVIDDDDPPSSPVGLRPVKTDFEPSPEQQELLDQIRHARAEGVTWKETGRPHSEVSADLSRLEDAGLVIRLKDVRRFKCNPYIDPQWIQGRPTVMDRKRAKPTMPSVEPVWRNQDLANMPFDQAYALKKFNDRNARIVVYTGTPHSAAVKAHIPMIVAKLSAEYPGLLDLLCDYRAAVE